MHPRPLLSAVAAFAIALTPAVAHTPAAHAATTGYLGVTFGFTGTTMHGGPYENL
jgi:hypothetical protein